MTEEPESVLKYPCEFPLRVIGHDRDGFELAVLEIVKKHVPGLEDEAFTTRSSNQGKYLSVAVTFTAESRTQLDNLYVELTAHPGVVWVL